MLGELSIIEAKEILDMYLATVDLLNRVNFSEILMVYCLLGLPSF